VAVVLVPFALLLSPASLQAKDWTVNPAKSTLGFTTSQAGTAIEGRFAKFSVEQLRFDPKTPQTARVRVVVDLISVDTQDDTRNRTLRAPDWFDSASSSTAVFQANGAKNSGPNQYDFTGTLTLKGITLPITLRTQIQISGDRAVAQGEAQVDRLRFKVGAQSDAKAQWIPKPVKIRFQLEAN
jgi:polyisoprenoid-binding protein YceI